MPWVTEERRNKRRIEAGLPIKYRILKAKGSALQGAITRDINTSGMKFRSNTFLPIMDKLFISIELSPSKSIDILASVIWSATVPYSDNYDIGAEFVGISEDARGELEDFLNNI